MADQELRINEQQFQVSRLFIGLSQLERQVDIDSLSIDQHSFKTDFINTQPSIFNSDTFATYFKEGFSRATGIPTGSLYEPKVGRTVGLSSIRLSLEGEAQYNLPMSYRAIDQTREQFLKQLRDLVNSDQRFKTFYLTHQNQFQIDNEKYFRSLVANETDSEALVGKYRQAEALMGQVCAYYYIQHKLLDDKIKQQTAEGRKVAAMTREEEQGFKILKITLAQRWFKSELIHEGKPADIEAIWKDRLEPQTDEAFGRLVDYLMGKYGARIFESMIDHCFKQIHHDSEVYGVHADAQTFALADTQEAIDEAGHIYPFIEQNLENQRVINIEFLPGNAYFWKHMQTKYPDVYQRLIEVARRQFEQRSSRGSTHIEIHGVKFMASPIYSLYKIFKNNYKELLGLFPGIEQYANEEEVYLQLKFRYDHTLIASPLSRKRFILDDQFDSLL